MLGGLFKKKKTPEQLVRLLMDALDKDDAADAEVMVDLFVL